MKSGLKKYEGKTSALKCVLEENILFHRKQIGKRLWRGRMNYDFTHRYITGFFVGNFFFTGCPP